MSASPQRPLWTCPRCGRKFVTRNMWHSCSPHTVESFLAGKGPRARAMFNRFVELLQSCGPIEVSPAKTRVAFMVRVRFAGVYALSERGMTIAFALTRRLDHSRIRRVVQYGPKWYGHYLRLSSAAELDEQVRKWLRESYQVGLQRRD